MRATASFLAVAILAVVVAARSNKATEKDVGSSTSVAWKYETYVPIVSSPLLFRGLVIFGSTDTHVYALNQATGTVAWKFRTNNRVTASPCVSHDLGLVFIGSTDNNFYALNATTGAQYWKYTTSEPTRHGKFCSVGKENVFFSVKGDSIYAVNMLYGTKAWYQINGHSSPVVSDDCNVVFVGSTVGYFYAYTADSGSQKWYYDGDTLGDYGNPTYRYGQIFIGAKDKHVRALNVETGDKNWKANMGSSMRWTTMAADRGQVVGATEDGWLFSLNEASGTIKWDKEVSGTSFYSGTAASGGLMYVGDNNGLLHIRDVLTGSSKGSFQSNGKFEWSHTPAVGDGFVFFGTENGTLYCINYAAAVAPPAKRCPTPAPPVTPIPWTNSPYTPVPAWTYAPPVTNAPSGGAGIVVTTCLNSSCIDCRPVRNLPGCVQTTATTSILRECRSSGQVLRVTSFADSATCNPLSQGTSVAEYSLLKCYNEDVGSFVVTQCN